MRTYMLVAGLLTAVVAHRAAGEDPVYFADEDLKAAVETELWILDPTPTDMLGLVSLVCSNAYDAEEVITDLTGLEYAVNLQTLNLRYHGITNLSALSGLINLETLIVQRNRISDISGLSGLSSLRVLDLERNTVSDISALSGLDNLEWLSLHRNQVSDISALGGLTALETVDLRINPLNEEAYDIYIPQIIANNPGIWIVHDGSYLRHLSISSTVGGSVVDPGEGEFTYEPRELVWVRAVADPGFVFVNFSGSCFTSRNPTSIEMDQDYQIRANFRSTLEVICVDDDAPNDPGPGDAAVSDPHENGTFQHPFDQIQEAIDVAADGASVVVRSGTYRENISLSGKGLRLVGLDPNDPNAGPYPVIEGAGSGPVVTVSSDQYQRCALDGFVITAGEGENAGALHCTGGSPTVRHCLIVGNRATGAAGAAVCCTESAAVFANCTVADNGGGPNGAGMVLIDSDVVVMDSILWNNVPRQILVKGTSGPSITYSDVLGWWPDWGNIDEDPLFVQHGYWADPGDPDVAVAPSVPNAIWIGGDYHLRSQAGRWDPAAQAWVQDEITSPCIDAGDPTGPAGCEVPPNGGVVNMGAYGQTSQASKSWLSL